MDHELPLSRNFLFGCMKNSEEKWSDEKESVKTDRGSRKMEIFCQSPGGRVW